jgi:hypothetical protein
MSDHRRFIAGATRSNSAAEGYEDIEPTYELIGQPDGGRRINHREAHHNRAVAFMSTASSRQPS